MAVPAPFTEEEEAKVRAFGLDVPQSYVRQYLLGAWNKRDARDDFHLECDCVPDLGHSHCHACGELGDSVVEWSRALELHSVVRS